MSAQRVDALSGPASIQELPAVEQDELDRPRKRHPSDGVTGRSRADEDRWLVLGLAVGVAARCRIPGSRMERRQAVWATPRAVVPAGVQQESGQFNSRPPGPVCIHDPSDPARSRVPDAPRRPRKSALFDPPAARRGPAVRRHARRLIAAPSTRPARVSLSPSSPAFPARLSTAHRDIRARGQRRHLGRCDPQRSSRTQRDRTAVGRSRPPCTRSCPSRRREPPAQTVPTFE